MEISWFPGEIIDTGFLGLTHTPGARQASRDEDLASLAAEGVSRIVCLQQPFEFNYVVTGTESLEERTRNVEAHGMEFTHFPIEDFGTPDIDGAAALVREIQDELASGRRLIVHCFAGLGRAGTVASCVLVARGLPADDAVAVVRRVRPGAVQTAAQQQFVSAYEAEYGASKKT